jgi:hypothetical protein
MDVAERLFKRARKLRRAVDAVQPLLEAALQELDYLESVRPWGTPYNTATTAQQPATECCNSRGHSQKTMP